MATFGNYATLNPLDYKNTANDATVTNGNLTSTHTSGGGSIYFRCTIALPVTGKYVWEVTVNDIASDMMIGVRDTELTISSASGHPGAYYYKNDGTKQVNGTNSSYGASYTDDDVIRVEYNSDANSIEFFKNGASQGSFSVSSDIEVPACHHNDSTSGLTLNFGQTDFVGTPTSGFLTLNTSNLPEPSPINYQDEYYILAGIVHTTGTTTDVNLPKTVSGGAMVRIKETDAATDWFIFDTVRGVNKSRKWNEAEAESTNTFDDQNLTGTTFTMPSDLPSGTYLLECFFVGDYFQIQTFTGNAGARTITWPSAMDSYGWAAFFPRTGASSGIQHHKDIGAQQILFCDNNSVAADRTNFSQAPNKTDFRTPSSVGPDFNLNNIPYVCYGWANSGPYRFGTYEGNAATDGTFINIGGFAAVMVVKNVDSAASYQAVPRVLQNYNSGANASLQWDNTGVGGTAAFDVLSNGAKMRTANVNYNSAHTFIYMAFGIQPLTDAEINQARADGTGGAPLAIATGGTITLDGNFAINTFTASGAIIFSKAPVDGVEYLVIAGGGGGGGSYRGGGGGAGGFRTATGLAVEGISYAITVGAGGAGGAQAVGADGANSVFSSITSTGGGGGGTYNGGAGRAGGSGGGGAGASGTGGGRNATVQGNVGGAGHASHQIGGGGGGAGAAGFDGGNGATDGDGGVGLASSISGSSVLRSGGGGAGNYGTANQAIGGLGGGGAGGVGLNNNDGTAGSANTGGGGGGSGGNNSNGDGGAGGSGVVIIRYKYK